MKVLFICKKRIDSYGETIGLINSSRFIASYLNSKGIESIVEEAVDGNCIDRLITKINPNITIIEALWITPDKLKELAKLYPTMNWIIRIHSKLPFLAQEGIAIDWINQYTQIVLDGSIQLKIAPNTNELADQLNDLFGTEKLFVTLKNIYDIKTKESYKRNNFDYINIGCFGAIRPMKNQLSQTLAAIEFGNLIGKKVHFHINSNRIEQEGSNILKNIRVLFKDSDHELVEHTWYKHDEFLKVIKTMDIGMQVSLTESFNIVTADFVSKWIPIVVSEDIEWMPDFTKCKPTDYKQIVTKLKDAYRNPRFYTRNSFRNLEKYNKSAYKDWDNLVKIC